MIPPTAQAVVFDAVGTVIQPAVPVPQVYAEIARRHGLVVEPEAVQNRFLTAFRAEELRDRQAGWVTSEERERVRWQSIVTASLPGASISVFDELYAHYARPAAWRVPTEAAAVFATLTARGLSLGLGSNFDSRLAAVIRGHPELSPLTGCMVISSRVGVRKPGPGFFVQVCHKLGSEPASVVVVGDDFENDYLGARAFGMTAILLDPRDRHPGVPQRITTLAELV